MAFRAALEQAWPPFVLVAGLLLVGLIDHVEGLFAWAADWLERIGGGPRTLFLASCVVVAAVTAVLNLDTAVVFLTPILILAARRRGVDERAFLFAALYLANASSLFLPGSNLTNLLVLAQEPVSGATFAARMLAPALAAVIATTGGLLFIFRANLTQRPEARASAARTAGPAPAWAIAVTLAAAVLTLALRHPAIYVLALGALAGATQVARGRLNLRALLDALGLRALAGLFCASVALGVLARTWHAPAQLLAHADRWGTAAIGAAGAISVNNLPAAVLLSARPVAHPRALLVGLNLGPNLAVTGSLSAYLWYRAARQIDTRPSLREFSRHGIPLAVAASVTALLAITILSTPS